MQDIHDAALRVWENLDGFVGSLERLEELRKNRVAEFSPEQTRHVLRLVGYRNKGQASLRELNTRVNSVLNMFPAVEEQDEEQDEESEDVSSNIPLIVAPYFN